MVTCTRCQLARSIHNTSSQIYSGAVYNSQSPSSPMASAHRRPRSILMCAICGISQVTATPLDFNSRGLCGIPTKKYGHHGHPVLNELVTFVLEDSDGQLVTAWSPGETYSLTTASALSKKVHTFVQVSVGTFEVLHEGPEAEAGFVARACNNAWGSHRPHHQHSVTWIAPEAASDEIQCALFSASQASAEHEAYQTNTVEICSHHAADNSSQITAADTPVSKVPVSMESVAGVNPVSTLSHNFVFNGTEPSLRTHSLGSNVREGAAQGYDVQGRSSSWQNVLVVIGGSATLAAAAALIVKALHGRHSYDAWVRTGIKAHRSSSTLRAPLLEHGAVVPPPRGRSLERTRSHPFAP